MHKVIKTFTHGNNTYKRGDTVNFSERLAAELIKKNKLVKEVKTVKKSKK